MSDVDKTFAKIAAAYRKSQGGPVAERKERAELYGLYKQATEGDINIKQPGFFNVFDQAKYRAWKAKQGMPQQEAKRRYIELAKEVGYRDPGDSPVPFISDETWRREESWTNLDHEERFACIHDPKLVVATDDDRRAAPTIANGEKAPMAPKGKAAQHLERLKSVPDTLAFHLYSPTWPVCCERLTTLVGFRGVDEPFEPVVPQAYLLREEENEDDWDTAIDETIDEPQNQAYGEDQLRSDHALFHCPDCGSVYVSGHDG